MMHNSYKIDEPAAISFSGGRTSAYMLCKILDAHDGILPQDHVVLFCNTGKEHEESLAYVHRCERELSVDIVWLELAKMVRVDDKYVKEYKVTDFKNASRKGEPFQILLDAMPAIPNVVNMACTAYLKTRIMRMYCDDIGMERGCVTVVGMRADEGGRAVKLHNKKVEGFTGYCPLYIDGVTKADVGKFWDEMPWDLELHNDKGMTPKGNCLLCFKKSIKKRYSIIQEDPSLADFWIKAEKDKGQFFRPDQPSYTQMKEYALAQDDMFADSTDESMPCFCSD